MLNTLNEQWRNVEVKPKPWETTNLRWWLKDSTLDMFKLSPFLVLKVQWLRRQLRKKDVSTLSDSETKFYTNEFMQYGKELHDRDLIETNDYVFTNGWKVLV